MAKGTQMQKSDEASEKQIKLAKKQGDALGDALKEMIENEAHGEERQVGDYLIGYAVEEAEGMYVHRDGSFEWQKPEEENAHIEVSVRSAADGRFIPGCTVRVSVESSDGKSVGTHEQPFLWHPWLYHYGRNWKLPKSGQYKLSIHIDPPTYSRHDRKNGNLFTKAADVEFSDVKIETGQK